MIITPHMFLGCIHWSGENIRIIQYFSCANITLLREINFGDLVNWQCSLAFWFLPGLFSTNLDLLGPQLFHFYQDYNVKTANIYHCSDLPHCTRKTVDNFPPFSSQSKACYPNLLQSNLFSNTNALTNPKNPNPSVLITMATPTVLNKAWPVTEL